ncbi:MAG: hypothetical protein NZ954_06830 [Thermofilaceae archaeon]|nr:hypothetical protein [Thermofilaceae archaeon]MCX8179779.1 hypothetical protein [Thermofilaceae archaeon]MDW8004306.1 hypothetical protein [Thermofilaceae archaeon]
MNCRVILDSNLLVDYLSSDLISNEGSLPFKLVEKLLQLSYDERCEILLPELIVDVECRRALSRLIIVHHLTNKDKLSVIVRSLKYIREEFEIFNCKIIDSWNPEILSRAAGIFYRLRDPSWGDGTGT